MRGVKLYVDDAFTKENYTWAHMEGRPQRDNWYQCPASSVRAPGECNVSWYMQAKGHYFWALYPSEYDGSLVAKWVRGRQPAGGVMWRADYAADISCGPASGASVNGFNFVTGITLDRSGNDFPIVLYMEREPRNGGVEKLHMLACKTVPKAVRRILHPGAFQPRKKFPGWTQDPGRREERALGRCKRWSSGRTTLAPTSSAELARWSSGRSVIQRGRTLAPSAPRARSLRTQSMKNQ